MSRSNWGSGELRMLLNSMPARNILKVNIAAWKTAEVGGARFLLNINAGAPNVMTGMLSNYALKQLRWRKCSRYISHQVFSFWTHRLDFCTGTALAGQVWPLT